MEGKDSCPQLQDLAPTLRRVREIVQERFNLLNKWRAGEQLAITHAEAWYAKHAASLPHTEEANSDAPATSNVALIERQKLIVVTQSDIDAGSGVDPWMSEPIFDYLIRALRDYELKGEATSLEDKVWRSRTISESALTVDQRQKDEHELVIEMLGLIDRLLEVIAPADKVKGVKSKGAIDKTTKNGGAIYDKDVWMPRFEAWQSLKAAKGCSVRQYAASIPEEFELVDKAFKAMRAENSRARRQKPHP